MKKLRMTLPFSPSVNQYLMPVIKYRGRKAYAQNIKQPKVRKYEKSVETIIKKCIKEQGWKLSPSGQRVDVTFDFYKPNKGIDTHNYFKIIMDCFSGQVYYDDSDATVSTNVMVIDKFNPRIEITIELSERLGVFDNQEHLDKFKQSYCDRCSKNSDKCTILRAMKENRVHEEVKDFKCMKFKTKK